MMHWTRCLFLDAVKLANRVDEDVIEFAAIFCLVSVEEKVCYYIECMVGRFCVGLDSADERQCIFIF